MQKFQKAIAAVIVGGAGALVTAAVDDVGIAGNEWWIILGTALLSGGSVYYTPNKT
jgi:hypothetical protein